MYETYHHNVYYLIEAYLIAEVVDVCVVLHLHDVMVCLPDTICWRRVEASATATATSSTLGPVASVHLVAVLRSPSHPRTFRESVANFHAKSVAAKGPALSQKYLVTQALQDGLTQGVSRLLPRGYEDGAEV